MAKKGVSLKDIKKDILEFNTKGIVYLVVIVIGIMMLMQVLTQGQMTGQSMFDNFFGAFQDMISPEDIPGGEIIPPGDVYEGLPETEQCDPLDPLTDENCVLVRDSCVPGTNEGCIYISTNKIYCCCADNTGKIRENSERQQTLTVCQNTNSKTGCKTFCAGKRSKGSWACSSTKNCPGGPWFKY